MLNVNREDVEMKINKKILLYVFLESIRATADLNLQDNVPNIKLNEERVHR